MHETHRAYDQVTGTVYRDIIERLRKHVRDHRTRRNTERNTARGIKHISQDNSPMQQTVYNRREEQYEKHGFYSETI